VNMIEYAFPAFAKMFAPPTPNNFCNGQVSKLVFESLTDNIDILVCLGEVSHSLLLLLCVPQRCNVFDLSPWLVVVVLVLQDLLDLGLHREIHVVDRSLLHGKVQLLLLDIGNRREILWILLRNISFGSECNSLQFQLPIDHSRLGPNSRIKLVLHPAFHQLWTHHLRLFLLFMVCKCLSFHLVSTTRNRTRTRFISKYKFHFIWKIKLKKNKEKNEKKNFQTENFIKVKTYHIF
jgi:hypothetical protein